MGGMIRIAGAILVGVSGAVMGIYMGRGLRLRVRVLGLVIFALQTIESEIAFARTPLPDIIKKLARCGETPVSRLFREMSTHFETHNHASFAEVWCGCIRRNKDELALTHDETEILYDLGGSLGRYDLDTEERTLKLATRRLERCLEAARERQVKEGRLCSTLGLSAGIISAIILL